MADYLKAEVEELGFPIKSFSDTGVDTQGTLEDCMILNLHLRTAFRVLFMIDEFEAENPQQLYESLVEIPWEEYIAADGYFSVSGFVENINIRDTRFANLKVKDAVVDRMQKKTNRRPDSGPETNRLVLYLYWKNTDAAIFIDTSGDTIAKHGYRRQPWKAPMQEALAAAVIMAGKWDKESHFINPMCGSGTLAIEAALLAMNKGPGLMRANFGFMYIPGYDPELLREMKHHAAKSIRNDLNFKIIASDISEQALEAARVNARNARVERFIEFQLCSFEDTVFPPGPGVIIMNPEYGERLGEVEQLEKTYPAIGDFLKQKAGGYTAYVFTASMDLAKRIGLKASRRIPFYNGTLDCRLLEYELYAGTRRVFESRER
jgi:putative N6-adenine-specific DNA methylase